MIEIPYPAEVQEIPGVTVPAGTTWAVVIGGVVGQWVAWVMSNRAGQNNCGGLRFPLACVIRYAYI